MEIVKKGPDEAPLNFPGVCVFTRDSEGPFLDTKTWLNARDIGGVDPYGYIHVAKVIDMGRAVGMVSKSDYDAQLERADAAEAKVAELEKLLEAHRTIKDAARVLVSS